MPTTISSSKKGASKPPPDEDSDVDIEGKIDKQILLLCRAQCVSLSPSLVGLVSRLMRRRRVVLPPSPEVEGIVAMKDFVAFLSFSICQFANPHTKTTTKKSTLGNSWNRFLTLYPSFHSALSYCTGIDQEDDDYAESGSQGGDDEDTEDAEAISARNKESEKEVDEMALKEQRELEAAKKERMELIAAEQKSLTSEDAVPNQAKATLEEKFHYLVSQSEVFAHFLAGEYGML